MKFIYDYILFQNVIKNHFIIIFKIDWQKEIRKIWQGFTSNHKVNNLMQKYPDIIESYAYILKIFMKFFLPINLLIFSRMCSTPKLSKYVTLSLLI